MNRFGIRVGEIIVPVYLKKCFSIRLLAALLESEEIISVSDDNMLGILAEKPNQELIFGITQFKNRKHHRVFGTLFN